MSEFRPPIVEHDHDPKHVTPLDLLSSDNYTTREIRDERLVICNDCPQFFKIMHTCKECNCIMAMKTWLKDATCPLGKW